MGRDAEIVRRFRRLRALLLGDVMLDTYLEGTAARLCREGPVPVVQKTAERRVPGGAGNAAANLRALGAEVTLVGVTGRDVAATLLRGALEALGVDTSCLLEDPRIATLHKLRVLADGQYVVRFDDGGEVALPRALERRVLAAIEERMPQCDVVVVSDYSYGLMTPAVIARLRELRAIYPRPLLVDAKHLIRYRGAGATVVTPNFQEARLLVESRWPSTPRARPSPFRGAGVPPAGPAGDLALAESTGRQVLTVLDAEHAAVTLAGDGVLLVGRSGEALHVPAHPVAHANDVGAGDSFAAAMALALGAGADAPSAARIGTDAAGIAVTKRYTVVATRHELLQRVSLREHTSDGRPRTQTGPAAVRRAIIRLGAELDAARQAGRCIVFTNGVFDTLHAGHVEFLRQAKALGDVLVVGVNTDRGALRLKGSLPRSDERDRLALVAALDPVDHAVLFDEENPAALIRALRPHIHVKGGDYADEPLPEDDAVRAVGGRVVILPLVGGRDEPSGRHGRRRSAGSAPLAASAAGGAR